jgi:hypothetical protein
MLYCVHTCKRLYTALLSFMLQEKDRALFGNVLIYIQNDILNR